MALVVQRWGQGEMEQLCGGNSFGISAWFEGAGVQGPVREPRGHQCRSKEGEGRIAMRAWGCSGGGSDKVNGAAKMGGRGRRKRRKGIKGRRRDDDLGISSL